MNTIQAIKAGLIRIAAILFPKWIKNSQTFFVKPTDSYNVDFSVRLDGVLRVDGLVVLDKAPAPLFPTWIKISELFYVTNAQVFETTTVTKLDGILRLDGLVKLK